VVDDEAFRITHVIRAEEHLSNTPRQVFIAQGLGYALPQYAHLPFVAEPGSRTKLSKRKLDKYLKNRDFADLMERGQHIAAALGVQTSPETFNPVITDFYEQIGFLPEALVNYLALLGWSLDDRTEHFTRQELIDNFSLDRVNKAPASFDSKKLMAFQDHHMQLLPIEQKMAIAEPYLQRAGLLGTPVGPDQRGQLQRIIEAAGDRIKIAGDVLDYAAFFQPDDAFQYEPASFEKALGKPLSREVLGKFRDCLASIDDFQPAPLEQELHNFVTRQGIKIGEIIHPLRVALTGKSIGFGLFDALAILGKPRSLARIDRALKPV